jgi:hypothetical protein
MDFGVGRAAPPAGMGPRSGAMAGSAGGEGGIRTHGTVSRSGAFKAPALVHYATPPRDGTPAGTRRAAPEGPSLAEPVGGGHGTLGACRQW